MVSGPSTISTLAPRSPRLPTPQTLVWHTRLSLSLSLLHSCSWSNEYLAAIFPCAAFTAASFHPDGLLLGTGDANGVVRVWDVKSQQVIASFEGHSGPVKFSFSENGCVDLNHARRDGLR